VWHFGEGRYVLCGVGEDEYVSCGIVGRAGMYYVA